jgi:hypothetical protein
VEGVSVKWGRDEVEKRSILKEKINKGVNRFGVRR